MPRPTAIWITETLRHYDTLGKHFWFFVYLLTQADPDTGYVSQPYAPIAKKLAVSEVKLKQWVGILEEQGYLHDESWNHLLRVKICGLMLYDGRLDCSASQN
jgi:hypothetical protein